MSTNQPLDLPEDDRPSPRGRTGPPKIAIKLNCRGCGRQMWVRPERAGADVQCRVCDVVTIVPRRDKKGDGSLVSSRESWGWVCVVAGAWVSVVNGCQSHEKAHRVVPLDQLPEMRRQVDTHELWAMAGLGLAGGGLFAALYHGRGESLRERVMSMAPLEGVAESGFRDTLGEPNGVARLGGQVLLTWEARGYTITLAFSDGVCKEVVREFRR